LPWSVHPEHDDSWFYNETRNLSKRKVAQEYLCNFNTSGETVISGEDLSEMKKYTKEPQYKSYADRNYHIWKTFNPDGSYLLAADVARGDGRDYSVFHVLDIKNMEQVAEYQGKIDIDSFSKLLFDVGREYGNCMIVVENNNIGFSVLSKLVDLRYPNLYYSTKGSNEFIDSGAALYSSNSVPGFSTTMKTRPLVIAKLEEYIRSKTLKINSGRTINELDTFLWVNSRPEAQKGYNDDLVLSLAIGCWIRDTVLVNNDRNIEYSKVLLNGIMKSNNYLNTSIQGMQNYEYSQRVQQQQQQYKEFMWVLKG
jgi:hypothetical protein